MSSEIVTLTDRVKQLSYTTGTGPCEFYSVADGFSSFANVYASGDALFYAITDGVDYEVGSGQYLNDGSTETLARFPFRSSNGDALVNFPVGLKEVYVTYPGDYAVYTSNGIANFQQPSPSGLAFWGSSQILSYDEYAVWDADSHRLGLQQPAPQYALDIGGVEGYSAINVSGLIVGDSGVLFSGTDPGSYNGRQVEPFLKNALDNATGSDAIFQLSGVVDESLLLVKQQATTVWCGPSGDAGVPTDYPTFRQLRMDDIPEISGYIGGAINANGVLVVPVRATVPTVISEISATNLGAIAFASGYIMIANGTSWVSGQLN